MQTKAVSFDIQSLELILDGLKCLTLYRWGRLLKMAHKRGDTETANKYQLVILETRALYEDISTLYKEVLEQQKDADKQMRMKLN